MKLPVRLALRYIVKRRSGTLVHLISGISVTVIAAVAVIAATAAILVVSGSDVGGSCDARRRPNLLLP